jgi:hypothetical protein
LDHLPHLMVEDVVVVMLVLLVQVVLAVVVDGL